MKTKEIKKQLEIMYKFMDAEAYLCGRADISFDYASYIERGYQTIAERLGVTVEEVEKVDACL